MKLLIQATLSYLLLTSLFFEFVSAPHYGQLIADSITLSTIGLFLFVDTFLKYSAMGKNLSLPGILGCAFVIIDGVLRYFWGIRVLQWFY